MKLKLISNIIESYKHIPYTLEHRNAYIIVANELFSKSAYFMTKKIPWNYYMHDMDKVLMYIFLPFLGTKIIKNIHRNCNKHHLKYSNGTYKPYGKYDIVGAIIDYECARLTKIDKVKNAYDTFIVKFPDRYEEASLYLKAVGINRPTGTYKLDCEK